MDDHPIQGLMTTTLENLKEMIEVNTIIGEPVESPDGSVIIPVSKLGFGFAAGGSEFSIDNKESQSDGLPFGGGSGGGISITPVAFLIVNEKETKMIHLDDKTDIYEKLIDIAPQAANKVQDILKQSIKTDNKKGKSDQHTNFEI